jgi:hypothetical protein
MTGANSSPGIISLGKMRRTLDVLSPLLAMSRGFFVALPCWGGAREGVATAKPLPDGQAGGLQAAAKIESL